METLSLEGHEYIELHNLLKLKGFFQSGGAAKQAIEAAKVTVDGQVELRKRCKIKAGQVVQYEGRSVQVTG